MFTAEGPHWVPQGGLLPPGVEECACGLTSDRSGMTPGPGNGFFTCLQSWLRASLTQALLLSQ